MKPHSIPKPKRYLSLALGMAFLANAELPAQVLAPAPPVVIQGLTLPTQTRYYYFPSSIISPDQASSPVNLYGTSNVTMESMTAVHLKPGFSAHGYTGNGVFKARIAEDGLQVKAPASGSVFKYAKYELAVKMPADIQYLIDDFLGLNQGSPPMTDGIGAYAGINPFNPEDISLEATFTSPSGATHTAYGFFYKDYQYVTLPGTSAPEFRKTWEEIIDPYQWRIRFAPDEAGEWKCAIKVVVGTTFQSQIRTDNLNLWPFKFDCEIGDPTENAAHYRGYLEPGTQHYLRFSDNHESFFGIGAYIGWANYRFGADGAPANPAAGPNREPVGCRVFEYDDFKDVLQITKDANANLVRLIIANQSWGLEWEYLGNYSNRMNHAWEFDNIIEYLEANGLYANICVQFEPAGEGNLAKNDEADHMLWDISPYRLRLFNATNGYDQPADPTLFITEEVAKKYHKMKMRYIHSRWGYSTHVFQYELMSEANLYGGGQILDNQGNLIPGTQYHPYWNVQESQCALPLSYRFDTSANWTWARPGGPQKRFSEYMQEWNDEMSTYFKQSLKAKQLITTSYQGIPEAENDHSFGLSNFNSSMFHLYNIGWYYEKWNFDHSQSYRLLYNQPYAPGEFGLYDTEHQPHSNYNGPAYFNDVTMHNTAWAMAFSGPYMVNSPIIPGPYPTSDVAWDQKGELRGYYTNVTPPLAAFMEDVDLETVDYDYMFDEGNYTRINDNDHLQFVKMTANNQAMGYIRLASWYWAATDQPGPPNCQIDTDLKAAKLLYVPPSGPCDYQMITPCNPPPGYTGPYTLKTYRFCESGDPFLGALPNTISNGVLYLTFEQPGTYQVDWYDTRSVSTIPIASSTAATQHSSWLHENVQFPIPTLAPPVNGCTTCIPDIAYKVHKVGVPFQKMAETQVEAESMIAYPNPSNGSMRLSLTTLATRDADLQVSDAYGKVVYQQRLSLAEGHNDLALPLEHLAQGIYFLKVEGFDKVQRISIAGK